jgi:hypothetical protein
MRWFDRLRIWALKAALGRLAKRYRQAAARGDGAAALRHHAKAVRIFGWLEALLSRQAGGRS